MFIDNLVIETTRKCNMSCAHCLRGPAENQDMQPVYIDKMFSLVTRIQELTLTGGEPSLNPQCIDQIIFLANKHNVSIDNFFLYTNQLLHAKTKDFQLSLIQLYQICESNEITTIGLSNDEYHTANWTTKLADYSWFKKTCKQYSEDGHAMVNPVNEGNQKINFNTGLTEPFSEIDIELPLIYLNCHGYIISGCDFSYERQASDDNIIVGHVNEITDLKETILQYNKKIQLIKKTVASQNTYGV